MGTLTQHQKTMFDNFRAILQKANLYNPDTHDDATLIRFLRARRYDPVKAHDQFAKTEAWRKENDVDNLYATFPTDEMQRAKLFYPRWTGRRDKQGVPVYVYKLSSLDSRMQKELNATSEKRRYERIVALWEFMRLFTLPLCSALPHAPPLPATPHPHSDASTKAVDEVPAASDIATVSGVVAPSSNVPITSVFSIIDLGGVSMTTMWSLRHHLQQASELATAHYPETLHRIAVVNAPSFFGTVWGWIKAWFDEGTRTKVHVLDSNPGPTLLTMIDAENLPKIYGGELAFEFADEPILDAPAREALGQDTLPAGPVVYNVTERKWTRPAGYVESQPSPQTVAGEDSDTVVGSESSARSSVDEGTLRKSDSTKSKRRWLNFSSTN